MLHHIKMAVIAAITLLSCWAASAQVQFTTPIAFATGTQPSIATDRTGFIIEVHQSGNDTSFMFGQLSGQTVTWGPSKVFPWKMFNARVNMIDRAGGVVILSYTGEPFGGGCFDRVGFINTRGGLDGDFIWNTGEEKWGTCDYTWNSRIVFNSRDVFGIYSDSSQIFYRAGDLRSHRPIWQTDPTYIDDGRDVDIAFNEGQLVEMNDKPGGIIDSRPAKVPGSGNPTIWGKSVHLPTNGVRGHAALNDSFHAASVVAIYYKAPFGLYTMTGRYLYGRIPKDPPTIEWISPEKEVFPGAVYNSDLANTGTAVIEVHEFQGSLYYAEAPMPAPNSAAQDSASSVQDKPVPADGQ
jgi:hypothetical protein